MAYCGGCHRQFIDQSAFEQHKRDSPLHRRANNGSRKEGCYCPQCVKYFPSTKALINHSEAVHYFCADHRRYFNSYEGLCSHYKAKNDHYYCEFCDELFGDEEDLMEHGDDFHWTCETCTLIFKDRDELMDHDEEEHIYCRQCDRHFNRQRDLDTHLNHSAYHQPRNIKCPGCPGRFISISGLLHHAESGNCTGGITRLAVNTYVARVDRKNIITNPNRLLTNSSGSRVPPVEPEYWATDLSFNGRAYECFLCHNQFRSLDSLNTHLKSPRHLSHIYRCPMKGCNTEYSVLSALCQHVERGECGVRKNRVVQNTIDSLTRGMRSVTE